MYNLVYWIRGSVAIPSSGWHPLHFSIIYFSPPGGRNLPRSLLGSADPEGGVFAVPTTLPPNSTRHNRMFSPNKEAELAFRQQLDSISVRLRTARPCWAT